MDAGRRLVLLGQTAAVERLQAEGGCRALCDPRRTLHIGLDGFLDAGHGRDSRAEHPSRAGSATNAEIVEALSLPPSDRRMPMVLLWVSERPGNIASLLDRLAKFGARVKDLLQADRLPLPVGSCILVAPNGWDAADIEAIRRLEVLATAAQRSDASDPLSTVLPARFAIYLMGDRLRAGPDGAVHDASEAWPVAVARLLGSIAISPGRSSGLRAWRSYGIELDASESATVEAMTLRFVRSAVAPAEIDATTSTEDRASGRRHVPVDLDLRVADAPGDRVSTSNCPRHAWDSPDIPGSAQAPTLPAFVALQPADDMSDSLERGGGTVAVAERLDERRRDSGWPVVKAQRGELFMHDRFQRIREALSTARGPRSIVARVWRVIHRTPRHLPWFARGGFYRAPETDDYERIGRQMIGWSRIGELDAVAREEFVKSKAQALELDLARSHFLATGWRVACAASAALWSAAAIGVATGSLRAGTTFWVGAAAAIGAGATAMILLVLERRAGSRGRDCLEEGIRRGEGAIESAFHARVALGADGELLHRSTAWMQSAARVRETAARLLDMKALEVDLRSSSTAGRSSASVAARGVPGRYRDATTIGSGPQTDPLGGDWTNLDALRDLEAQLRERFENWWTGFLLECDPTGVGGIPASRFRPAIGAVLDELIAHARSAVQARFDAAAERTWDSEAESRIAARLGLASDLGHLSLRTARARGRELDRVVRAHSPSRAARDVLARVGSQGLLGHGRALPEDGEDGWNGLGVLVEEISIGIEMDRDGRPSFVEGGRHAG